MVQVPNYTEGHLQMRITNKTHIVGDFFNNTVNGVSNVLSWCHQKRGNNQNDEGAFVMKPKDIVVWKKR